eukprot:6208133-Pleurochrysis_carterae.AAC.1
MKAAPTPPQPLPPCAGDVNGLFSRGCWTQQDEKTRSMMWPIAAPHTGIHCPKVRRKGGSKVGSSAICSSLGNIAM